MDVLLAFVDHICVVDGRHLVVVVIHFTGVVWVKEELYKGPEVNGFPLLSIEDRCKLMIFILMIYVLHVCFFIEAVFANIIV